MKSIFIVLRMTLIFSQICEQPNKENVRQNQSIKLFPNEKFILNGQIINVEGDLDLFHYEFGFSYMESYITSNHTQVIKTSVNQYATLIMDKYSIMACKVNICFQIYELPVKVHEELENLIQQGNQTIIQSRLMQSNEYFFVFYICNLEQCKNSNSLQLSTNDKQLLLGKQYIIITDISQQSIIIYKYILNSWNLIIEVYLQLNSQIIQELFSIKIYRFVSIECLEEEDKEYLFILNDQNQFFKFWIDAQVLKLYINIDTDHHILSYKYFQNTLIYTFEYDSKYYVYSDKLFENQYINKDTKILPIFGNYLEHFLLYNNTMIFQPNQSILPLQFSNNTNIYQHDTYLFIQEGISISQINVHNYYQTNYIEYSNVGNYYINILLFENIQCILNIEIGEQFNHTIQQIDTFILVSFDIFIHKDLIQIPGLKFELIEDQSNILESTYQSESHHFQNCLPENSKLNNELKNRQYYMMNQEQYNFNYIAHYKVFQQFEDGIYSFYCRNEKILSSTLVFPSIDMDLSYCYQDQNLIILSGNLIKSIEGEIMKEIEIESQKYKLDCDCVLTDDSNKLYKIWDNRIIEIHAWEIQHLSQVFRNNPNCVIQSISILAEAQILKLLTVNADTILIFYIISNRQCVAKYLIRECKLFKVYDLPFYNFVLDLPLKIQLYRNNIVIQAVLEDQKYLLLFELENSRRWECLKFVLKLETSEGYEYFQDNFAIFNKTINIINTKSWQITFNRQPDIKCLLKWRLSSEYVSLDHNVLQQTILFDRKYLSPVKEEYTIKFTSTTEKYLLDVSKLFKGPIHNITLLNNEQYLTSPLTQIMKIKLENLRIKQCCVKVNEDLYYITQQELIRYRNNQFIQKFTFQKNFSRLPIELIYLEKQKLLAVFLFDFNINQNFMQLVDLELNSLNIQQFSEMNTFQKIFQLEELIIIQVKFNLMLIFQFHDFEFIAIPTPEQYNQIHRIKNQTILYYLQDQIVHILRANIINFQIIPLEINQFNLSTKMMEFHNIELIVNEIQLFGNEQIEAMLFTSQGVFQMSLREKINKFIPVHIQQKSSFIVQNYLIAIINQFNASQNIQILVYNLTQQNILPSTVQSIILVNQNLYNSQMNNDGNHLFLISKGKEKLILVYEISNYSLQIAHKVQNISLTASNEHERLTIQIQISFRQIQFFQTCALSVYLIILGSFLGYKGRKKSYQKMENQ